MPRPLKVFAARLGFYDTVVAVPSQAAALRAWGTRQNLFADGVARVEEDEAAIAAARAHPGVPLKRGIGTGEPFGLNPSLPQLPDEAPAARNSGPAGSAARAKTPPPAPPDRSALDAAEARLAETEQRWREQEDAFARRRAALDDEEQRARADHEEALGRAEADRAHQQDRFDKAVARSPRG